ncbi:DNA-processing protein DprA [Sporosarcina thermotolerans]|uniref:DNA-processing protein DprA n=1 Tax=Sporosarcina thermotolerans TaxID=633404 RepID=A0AAW9A7W7_9BACL|nr:DNA-processing protein DprA [Sporosarcina thermotolerans]MDW0115746.1 DNA-processing protein DprA [Sporosarcina thermotolerans]WHT47003.1 DNA-processing protein DprA [Sporosarcina thermotolerans]
MEITEVDKRLLALHYVYPVPFNKLSEIMRNDPDLELLFNYYASDLARLLQIPEIKAVRLKEQLVLHEKTPFHLLYHQENIIPIPITNKNYPQSLKLLVDPPTVLYLRGMTSVLKASLKVAIIGSRKATDYSKKALSFIVPPLVDKGAVIVSGLAKGADTMAHESAIQYGGKTIAVLGHGLFHLYPYANRHLAQEIAKKHLLLTEYPPYMKPAKWTFPMRNRIISGLSESVIITESNEKSGTMSTVDHALEHGKAIYAVPGPITSSLSLGPNKLIVQGAKPIWNGFQVFEMS